MRAGSRRSGVGLSSDRYPANARTRRPAARPPQERGARPASAITPARSWSEQAGRKTQAGGQLRHVGRRGRARLVEGVIAGGENQVGEQLHTLFQGLGLDGDREDLLVPVRGDRHHSAPGGPGDGDVFELLLHLGHAGLHLLELLHHLLLVLHLRPRWAVYAPLADRGAPSLVSSWRRVAVTRLPAKVSSTAWVTSLTDPDGPRGRSSPGKLVSTSTGCPAMAHSASAITRRFSGSLICSWWKRPLVPMVTLVAPAATGLQSRKTPASPLFARATASM